MYGAYFDFEQHRIKVWSAHVSIYHKDILYYCLLNWSFIMEFKTFIMSNAHSILKAVTQHEPPSYAHSICRSSEQYKWVSWMLILFLTFHVGCWLPLSRRDTKAHPVTPNLEWRIRFTQPAIISSMWMGDLNHQPNERKTVEANRTRWSW